MNPADLYRDRKPGFALYFVKQMLETHNIDISENDCRFRIWERCSGATPKPQKWRR